VEDLGVPYILPQENGNRTGTSVLQLSGADGGRFAVSGRAWRNETGGAETVADNSYKSTAPAAIGPGFDFTAGRFGADQLYAARHWYEMRPKPETFLCLDAAQRGLGTASCGPDTLEKYRLRPGRYALELLFGI
jgi:beta-galactosidase